MKKFGFLSLALMFPFMAAAQIPANSLQSLLTGIIGFINNVAVPFVFAIAFIVFIWGIFTYFISGGADDDKRKKGKDLMLWGIVAFFVMASVWGLVNILRGSFALQNTIPPVVDLPSGNF